MLIIILPANILLTKSEGSFHFLVFQGGMRVIRVKADVTIHPDRVRSIIEKNYGVDVFSLEQVRAVYKVETSKGIYGFKNAEELLDLPFVVDCLQKMKKNGFPRVPDFLYAMDGQLLVYDENEAYFMEEWLDLKELPKHSRPYWEKIGEALANFHQASCSIGRPAPFHSRNRWGKQHVSIKKGYKRLLTLKSRFPSIPLLDYLQYRCEIAYEYIKNIAYEEIAYSGVWCHKGLQRRNIMLDHTMEIWFIDFETLSYAERVADLAHFLRQHADDYGWNPDSILRFLQSYQSGLADPIQQQEWSFFLSSLFYPKRWIAKFPQIYHDEYQLQRALDQEYQKEQSLRYLSRLLLSSRR